MSRLKPPASLWIGMVLLFVGSGNAEEPPAKTKTTVTLASEVDWQQLNPARGDQSPQAATLWGDRDGKEATGFLAKFVDGFSSPPTFTTLRTGLL